MQQKQATIDFMRWRWLAIGISCVLLLASIASLATRQLAFGLDFTGGTQIEVVYGEAVPLDDNSVDTAVVTFVLCTIPDWQAALQELRRVLKPGGKVLYSEHGLAPDDGIAKWQRRVEPVWKRLAGGCHLTRDTKQMLEAEGFAIDRHETMYLPNTPKIAGFAVWGSARVA